MKNELRFKYDAKHKVEKNPRNQYQCEDSSHLPAHTDSTGFESWDRFTGPTLCGQVLHIPNPSAWIWLFHFFSVDQLRVPKYAGQFGWR
ncbi:hypothetical protein [Burkholderia pyrrocinia]|uniref:hypothetical protein n=1 Tax=Burkholderia pyrrocinia TaxID=60550 RepID=UPI001BD0C1AC|nr:hypothetical protein [Burkholderia pyrrocinia]QVN21311.1 hypothetical protein JYG32_32855 [Burkholderia pyrrocinia]